MWLLVLLLLAAPFSYALETSAQYQTCEKDAIGQYDALICLNAEIKRQDQRLNTNYKAAMQTLEKSRKQDLKRIQRLWIKYRDAKCAFFYHPHSGSGGLMDEQQCILEETIRRADELEQLF